VEAVPALQKTHRKCNKPLCGLTTYNHGIAVGIKTISHADGLLVGLQQ
jgi:hypothetical protein